MDIFDHFLPWTELRVNSIDTDQWRLLLSPVAAIKQDQSIPITNLMVLLHTKIYGQCSLKETVHRRVLVRWYQTYAQSIFNLPQLFSLLEGKKANVAKNKKYGFNLIGYDQGRLGLGEDLRSYMLLLQQQGIPFSIYHIGHLTDKLDFDLKKYYSTQLPYQYSLFFLNPIELQKFVQVFDGELSGFGTTIAVPPWELPKLPDSWFNHLNKFDFIWAISEFVQQAYLNSSENKSKVEIANPIVIQKTQPLCSRIPRQSRPYTFLYIFDAASYLARKNPIGVINAFIKAFKSGNYDVRLILKVSNTNDSPEWNLVRHLATQDRRIKIIDDSYNEKEMSTLWLKTDCYVSLHRSEGFGRTIAEAVSLGLPVISTNWSGSIDIIGQDNPLNIDYNLVPVDAHQYPWSDEQFWAEPSIDDAADKMLWIVENHNSNDVAELVQNNTARFKTLFDINAKNRTLFNYFE
tara:strand:+ start:3330 stop:4712 length:1383 start_codon:yes stop_codon:yes gene_type:complete